ncbi:hypothetical protein LTR91_001338 [Friedmanniomyces endolithicus]|uniref:Polyprenal reductase n=1 Tax=Friedmanniomyces endolithicus TaxID=329885 RepID=A0AAN6R0N6_9PEZI|nr:hypothetical protein LTR87_011241 [Friedmanniomyces endolithicus]KAK0925880.1 hypothetical protein LTR57_004484 [Friedmanniomyces endolithicus]KAK0963314.1 hypothetical protein LTS01_019385 [Friedmanniomyces endolithicus]KAK1013741.1 hypothetical protein LTR91_001338 [Friedmanniomyces endolithicus]KAK1032941.1 hypothetical protein LTS16_016693 [Friedmanniomyces endolithicus]
MDITTILRSGYLAASALVLLVALIPPFRTRFLAYGARTFPFNGSSSAKKEKAGVAKPQNKSTLIAILDRLADLTVPHSWFTSFYVVCVGWSLVWASQLLTQGPLFWLVAALRRNDDGPAGCGSMGDVARTRESEAVRESGVCQAVEVEDVVRALDAGNWFLHGYWHGGVGGGDTWVLSKLSHGEGRDAYSIPAAVQAHTFSLDDIAVTGPDLRTFASVLLFILASGIQHDCHTYLASLKSKPATPPATKSVHLSKNGEGDSLEAAQYKLPDHPAFAYLIAPHYTAECLIYLSLTMVAAPQGSAWVNRTLACALVFVVVNLGATADVTREWYRGRFGEAAVKGKWRLVPYVW